LSSACEAASSLSEFVNESKSYEYTKFLPIELEKSYNETKAQYILTVFAKDLQTKLQEAPSTTHAKDLTIF
jgi:hypothetical protein